jgi:hypothetical protein
MPIYGNREILNVVLKDRTTGEPKLSLRTLKVSNLDFTAAQQMAKGGRGDPVLLLWKGSRVIL